MSATHGLGPWTVKVDVERIEVTSNVPQPDPEWSFWDAAGHYHRLMGGLYPTLEWRWDEDSDPDDEDRDGHYACRLCDELVNPGVTGPSMFPEYINGPSSVSLTYNDGTERREYAIFTTEDAAGLTNPETRQATIDRIASTQEPLTSTRRIRSFDDLPPKTAPNVGTLDWRVDRIERILNRIADPTDPANRDDTFATSVGIAGIIREEMRP